MYSYHTYVCVNAIKRIYPTLLIVPSWEGKWEMGMGKNEIIRNRSDGGLWFLVQRLLRTLIFCNIQVFFITVVLPYLQFCLLRFQLPMFNCSLKILNGKCDEILLCPRGVNHPFAQHIPLFSHLVANLVVRLWCLSACDQVDRKSVV